MERNLLQKLIIKEHGSQDLAENYLFSCKKLLDVGSGDKTNGLYPLKKILPHHMVESIDINQDAEPDIIGDANHIPRPNETYDGIHATAILEHLENPLVSLQEWNRVLKKGGKLFVCVPYNEDTQPHHLTVFRYPVELEILAKETGFKNIRVEQRIWLRFGQAFFGKLLTKGDLVLRCEK